jgi:hypothetical protein
LMQTNEATSWTFFMHRRLMVHMGRYISFDFFP